MNSDENKVAETSAAATAVAEPTHFDGWDDHGTPIVIEKTPPNKQESEPAAAPAKEAQSEPKGKSEAESETAPKQGKQRKPGEKLNADERIAQLTAKVRELEERDRSRAAETTPPAKTTEAAKQPETPKRPNLTTWTGTVEEYEAAMDTWEAGQRRKAVLEFQQAESAKTQREKLQQELDEVQDKYPDAKDKIHATVENLISRPKAPLPPVILAMFNDSECLTDLMYVLSDETTQINFIETAAKNPGKAIRALAQMEADILAKQSEQSKTESETKPPAETKPRAPKPPSEVGGRGSAPEDGLRTSAASGDFRGFEAEMNRRKFAKSA